MECGEGNGKARDVGIAVRCTGEAAQEGVDFDVPVVPFFDSAMAAVALVMRHSPLQRCSAGRFVARSGWPKLQRPLPKADGGTHGCSCGIEG